MHLLFLQEVDQLLIGKLMESVSMATTSLVSLVQLLDKVKNMVISDHIQHEASLKTLDSHYTIHRHMCPMQLLLWAKTVFAGIYMLQC